MSATGGGSGGVTCEELKAKCFLILRTCIFCWILIAASAGIGTILSNIVLSCGGGYGYVGYSTYYNCNPTFLYYIVPAVMIAALIEYSIYCSFHCMGKNVPDNHDLVYNIVAGVLCLVSFILGFAAHFGNYHGFLCVIGVIIYVICHFVIRKK
ncbi:unnamed protein product [Bursaphelenchus xylophilus]|uniref:(pine wood nematode) hypothetical protein n=1 Tax=Bursaphelenchus xylophilus TaxID=6326 RepID=A0A1I7S2L3_BURXY|nr:unnamed protein product [Bursaphelenchus xylophilus]CAG9121861.1 unnamed protein product [Bursaphelenchus xylophilus]